MTRRFAYNNGRILNNAAYFAHSAQGLGLRSYTDNCVYIYIYIFFFFFPKPTECDKTKFKIFMTNKLNRTRKQVRKYTHCHGANIPLHVNQQRCDQRKFPLRSNVALLLRHREITIWSTIFSFFYVGSKRVSICTP